MPREATQFKPGKSGNPAGRPKASKNRSQPSGDTPRELTREEAIAEYRDRGREHARAGEIELARRCLVKSLALIRSQQELATIGQRADAMIRLFTGDLETENRSDQVAAQVPDVA
jgi:hypothetical protein